MRTIVVLAIGIYIGQQLHKSFARNRFEALTKPKLLKLLAGYGISNEEAHKEIEKVFQE
jgi:hypothetical protein